MLLDIQYKPLIIIVRKMNTIKWIAHINLIDKAYIRISLLLWGVNL